MLSQFQLLTELTGRANLIHVTISNTITPPPPFNAAVFLCNVRQEGAIRNSIIANNRQQPAPALSNKACAGSDVQITNSIIEGTNDCGGSPITSDPVLSGLTGSPAYFPLGDNSPALGAGHITYCTATDQRGESRPQPVDSNCDIGAFEHLTLPLPPTGTPTATNTPTSTPTATYTASATLTLQPTLMPGGPIYVNADCPLPAAVTAANSDSSSHDLDCVPGSGDDEIILPSGGGTTTLSATLNISSNITITGNGHIISGNNAVRVISIGTSSGRLTLNNVTIENGWATGGSSFGGAIRITAGALTVNNSTFKNNRAAARGGAVYAAIAITIRNSTFSGNSATTGHRRRDCALSRRYNPLRIDSSDRSWRQYCRFRSRSLHAWERALQSAKQHNRQQKWHGGSKLSIRYGPHSDRQFGRDANKRMPGSDSHRRPRPGRPHRLAGVFSARRHKPGDRRWRLNVLYRR